MPDKPADKQLVQQVLDGDVNAFRAIVERYLGALLSIAYGVTGDYHEAQDIAQETFSRSYRRLHQLKQPERLGSWLYTMAERIAIDQRRKRKITIHYMDIDSRASAQLAHDEKRPEERVVLTSTVQDALAKLDAKSRAALLLFHVEDWSMKEIGMMLDLSVSAVESRIRRAREKMKSVLSDEFAAHFRPSVQNPICQDSVMKYVLKRAGHFYIPVTNRKQSAAWFARHFQLQLDAKGNIRLGTDQIVYFVEQSERSTYSSDVPLMLFSAADTDRLKAQLEQDGVVVQSASSDRFPSGLESFRFYDPDGNCFGVTELKLDRIKI